MKFSQCLCALLVMVMMNVGGGEGANKGTDVRRRKNCAAPLIPHNGGTDVQRRKNCTAPLRPHNGGIICITVNKTRYCKPMCNKHYDFAFLRRSRPFEKCGPATDYEWTTQYIGGHRLAECIESRHTSFISGLTTDYFNDTCKKERHTSETRIKEFWKTVKKAVMKTSIEAENYVKDHCFDPYYHCGNEFWKTVKKAVLKTSIEAEDCVKDHCFDPYDHCDKEFWETVKNAVTKTPKEAENYVKDHCFDYDYHCGKEF